MPTNTSGGTTTSFSNTPQGNADSYIYTEEELLSNSRIYNSATSTLILDVMANDLGGNAKSLYSIDDGGTGAMTDLLTSNVTTSWERTADGNCIRINAGKIEFRIDDGSGTVGSARDVNSLNQGECISDSFVYAIRLGNGTLAMATVTINLTGANDIATITGAATGAVTEDGDDLTTFQTTGGKLTVVDPDSGQNELRPIADTKGDAGYGTFDVAADGTWTYTLDNDDPKIQELAQGETLTDTITVTSEDGSDTQVITVTITGTNDVPTVTDVSTDASEDGAVVTGSFAGDDVDSDDDAASLTYAITSDPSEGSVHNNGDGTYSFDPGDDLQDLAEGQTREVTFTYTATDGHGAASNSGTVTVTVTGTNDAPTVTDVSTDASEDGAVVTGSFAGDDVDSDDDGATLTYAITSDPSAGSVLNNDDGTFSFDPGDDFQDLAEGETRDVTFTYTATDRHGAESTSGTVSVTITGTNDAPVISIEQGDSAAAQVDETNLGLTASGHLTITDVDTSDTVDVEVSSVGVSGDGSAGNLTNAQLLAMLSLSGETDNEADGTAGSLGWSFDSGNEAFDQLAEGETLVLTYTLTATDTQDASDTQTVTVTVTGTNDAPAISIEQGDSAAAQVDETNLGLTASGHLTITDVDTSDTVDVEVSSVGVSGDGSVGALTDEQLLAMLTLTGDADNAADGTAGSLGWSFDSGNEAFDQLADGETLVLTYTLTATDTQGETDTQTVSVTITGTNDAAVIGGDLSGTATEDGLGASGDANSTDVDNEDDSWIVATGAGANSYGTYTVDEQGHWTYAVDNDNADVDELNVGETLTDTFVIETSDGTQQTITVTINGANDGVTTPPVFTGTGDSNDNDTLVGTGTSSAPLISGTSNAETITGRTGSGQTADTINGLGGGDTINAGDGGDFVYGGSGNDTIHGGAGNDMLYGQAGDDFLYGEGNNDQLFGGTGDDYLDGGDNTDSLLAGGSGHDTIHGGANGDLIVGGFGADDLYGEAGNDTFKYVDVRDTGDTIHDWNSGDKIDLSAIDANGSGAGDLSFAWGGTTATANGAWYSVEDGNAIVYVDTDGDASTAEMTITLLGVTSLNSTDFAF